MRILLFSFFAFTLFAGCSESKSELTLKQQIDNFIAEQQFEEAHSLLDEQEESEGIAEQREKVHLQHGIYLIYNADPASMRENANNALREFIAVLEINPENEKARAETEQILNIYRTFPDRQPAEDVLEKLEELGFQI
ncbi:hypothetical protein [Gracilimonas halophila]|uniref:Tetratricopeptide repeat-containing protein n=1 Tax=Gracilimonas halophila TaxID=1834464 RepID=A0ABW5JFI0_9BACT